MIYSTEVLLSGRMEATPVYLDDLKTSHSAMTIESLERWSRTTFTSLWQGPDLEIAVVQTGRSSENWRWTVRGWREPDEIDGADQDGWVEECGREIAERAALRWYLEISESE